MVNHDTSYNRFKESRIDMHAPYMI
uniref:Uncharacterized protein n=1 Tax=Vitis vinifera TaxID=29760 RepID=F6HRB0_VITVI